MTTSPGSRVGELFGPYDLRSRIGVGGMGEVYRAYDTVKDRVVALKLLRPQFVADPSFQERFRRESRVAARLKEPHVIPVHDWGEINGVLYIDMRLVEGSDLKTVLAEGGPLNPGRATSIVAQVAAALDAAHASGLVHRDIKPANVLLTPDDFAYLVDFGIAHLGGDTGLTSAGAAIGSCAYMAPERFKGERAGPAADVYSLACLLYECLTGQLPFSTGDLTALMSAHMFLPPPRPSVVNPHVPPSFDDLIARGMAKEPDDRYGSAGALGRAAQRALQQERRAMSDADTMLAPYAPSPATRYASVDPRPSSATTGPTVLRGGPAYAERGGRWVVPTVLAASGALLGAVLVVVLWLAFGANRGNNPTTPTNPSTFGAGTQETSANSATGQKTPTTVSPPSSPPQVSLLPGTDALGFLAYPRARCDPGNPAAAMAMTAKSALVICSSGPATFYYRGVRFSDNASIELADAVRLSSGFDVTNPTDGTRYQIRPTGLTIKGPDGQVEFEPMVEYASS